MYVGYVDGAMLFHTSGAREYALLSGTLNEQLGSAAQLNFTITADNPLKDSIVPAASVVSVKEDGFEIFRGVVNSVSIDRRHNVSFVCTDMIAHTANILKAPFVVTAASKKPVADYVSAILGNYNDGVTDDKKILLGNVTATGTIAVEHHTEFTSIFDLFKECISLKGGTLMLRYEDGNVYLDYLAALGAENPQTIMFGKNLIDISSQIDTSTLLTRVYPVGKDGLTIASVNSGNTYLTNAEAEAIYGRIEKTMSVDSDSAAEVKSYAQAYLTRYAAERNSISLTALDLAKIDKTIAAFSIGENVRAVEPSLGIDAFMPLTAKATDMMRAGNCRVTLGSERQKITRIISK